MKSEKETLHTDRGLEDFWMILIIVAFMVFVCNNTLRGQVAINKTNLAPDVSSMLDLQSSSQGVLLPKISLPNLNSASPVNNPAQGLIIWNTNGLTGIGLHFWNGTAWQKMGQDGDQQNMNIVLVKGTDGNSLPIVNISKLGIGTNSPHANAGVEISSGSLPALMLTNADMVNPTLNWSATGTENAFFLLDQSNNTAPFRLSSFTGNEAIFLDNNGVGIGMNMPAHKLHINGSSYFMEQMGIGSVPNAGLDLVGDAYVSSKLGVAVAPSNAMDIVGNATVTGSQTADSFSATSLKVTKLYNGTNTTDISGKTLSSTGTGLVWNSTDLLADRLGNHTSLQNFNLSSFWLSGNGGTNGLKFHNGQLGVNNSAESGLAALIVNGSHNALINGFDIIYPQNLQTVLVNSVGATGSNRAVGLGFKNSSANGVSDIGGAIVHERTGSWSKGKLHFAAKTSTTSAANLPVQMTLDDNGELGIGITNPSQKLHVVGNGKFSNQLLVNSIGNGSLPGSSREVHLRTLDSPTIRFEQTTANGWAPYIWDFTANEYNFYIKTVSNANNLVFRIRASAPENSLVIDADGDIGLNIPGGQDAVIDYRLQVGTAGDGTEARANAWNLFSDKRWKRDFMVIPDALLKVKHLNGYYYFWKNKTDKSRQVGYIAQEIEEVLPDVVSEDSQGYLSLDYSKTNALLIEAIKELKERNENLKAGNDQLASELEEAKRILSMLKNEENDLKNTSQIRK